MLDNVKNQNRVAELASLIRRIQAASYEVETCEDSVGEGHDYMSWYEESFLAHLCSGDDGWLYVSDLTGRQFRLHLRFSTGDGPIVFDNVFNPVLVKVIEAHRAKFTPKGPAQ